jgi:tripartite-type tricarboxylate transporter receptor subunit TctC
MNRERLAAGSTFTAVVIFLFPVLAFSQSPFYEGKTITLVQATNPGGTGDLRRKALAPYLQKYIPGNPMIVSEYMPGGGGRKGANYIYRAARPDGLTIWGVSAPVVANAVLGAPGVEYDIDKFSYLGSPISVFHYVFLTRKEAGLSSLEKLRSVPGLRIGGQQVGHDNYIIARLFAYVIGMNDTKWVTGYSGPEVDVALVRGEVDAKATNVETIIQRNPEWIEKGLVDFHSIMEIPKGRKHPHSLFAQLPDFENFAKSDRDQKLLAMHRAFRLVGTPYILPPGTPKERVQILQEAMRKAFKDPGFHKEFKKLAGFDVSPLMPEEMERVIKEVPRDPEVIDLFKKIAGADLLPSR